MSAKQLITTDFAELEERVLNHFHLKERHSNGVIVAIVSASIKAQEVTNRVIQPSMLLVTGRSNYKHFGMVGRAIAFDEAHIVAKSVPPKKNNGPRDKYGRLGKWK